jgi:hypothetical protein
VSTPIPPAPPEGPSARRLVRSTAIAFAVASLILVTIVLPAEYGVDPTGIGRVLGLREMGEIKMQLAREAAQADSATAGGAAAPPAASPTAGAAAAVTADSSRSDVTEVVIAPTKARELKLVMRKDGLVTYLWSTNRGVVNYDTHADNATTKYHGYKKASSVSGDSGVLAAAFDGQHGWFWRNRGTDTVTVTLRTKGAYTDLKWIQ